MSEIDDIKSDGLFKIRFWVKLKFLKASVEARSWAKACEAPCPSPRQVVVEASW